MTKNLLQNLKARHGSLPGSIRLDERVRTPLPRSPIPIAPRPFIYDALKADHIRLLSIKPSRDRNTPIRASLEQQRVRNATYKAVFCLSEIEEPQETIYVNDQPMIVRAILVDALRDVRDDVERTFIWVECICIDSNNREEKQQQWKQMEEIRDHATEIIHWPWETSCKRRISDGATLDPWLSADKTAISHAWDPVLRITGIGSQNPMAVMDCQTYPQSPPPLTYDLDSPQTNSASSSPDGNADFHIQTGPTLQTIPLHLGSADFWNFSMEGFDLQQLRLGEESMETATNKAQRKRSLMTAFSGDVPAPYIQKVQQTKSAGADSNERGSSIIFACPFQKAYPQKYHKCLKYTLNRIKDVKQHIYRQHSKPDFYCARCYETFSSAADRDTHSRCAVCETRDPPRFEGISEEQRNDLKKSSPKRKPFHEQWFEVWDLLFPGRQRPQSAFIGNYVEEMAPLLRNLWNSKKAEIISGVVDSKSWGNGVDGELLAEIMDSVFDRFEEETARSSQRCNTESSKPQIDSFHGSFHTESDIQETEIGFNLDTVFNQQQLSEMGMHDFETDCAVDMGDYYTSQSVGASFGAELPP